MECGELMALLCSSSGSGDCTIVLHHYCVSTPSHHLHRVLLLPVCMVKKRIESFPGLEVGRFPSPLMDVLIENHGLGKEGEFF